MSASSAQLIRSARMTCFLNMTRFYDSWRYLAGKRTRLQPACVALASLAVLVAASDTAGARVRRERAAMAESVAPRPAGAPIMAIVSLRSQGIIVYDGSGWIMRAPVSSGQTGRETPAGIFSVIEKQAEHYSNLYDDAFMPHMHRITWSGIALHGGPLPGYAASHGCIRLPYDFASRLFDVSKVGMRVIVAPGDVAPVEIAHPALFPSKPGSADVAAARTAEAAEAARKADQAKRDAAAASREAAQATAPVRAVETLKRKAAARLAAAERTAAAAHADEAKLQKAEDARAKAAADLAEVDAKLDAAKADQQSKLDAATAARQASADAETRRTEAAEAARKAARELEPASVFISRKTQRLYVRQAFQPVLESPVMIQDPDRAIGTHVFTAVGRIDGAPDLRWNVVSLDRGHPDGRVAERYSPARDGSKLDVEPAPANADGAKAALDRIAIPQDVADRIAGMMSPRSSVIISDEALSPETGKGTDFVVVMNDEPQGGIKFRRHGSPVAPRRERMRDWQPQWGNPPPFGFPW
jgi:L,D-transpeptidase catalytic domain